MMKFIQRELSVVMLLTVTLLGCQTTPSVPSGPDFDPPPPNVKIKKASEISGNVDKKYLNLLGTWEGAFRGGSSYKKIQMTFYDITEPGVVSAIYGHGTYSNKPYKPGLIKSKISFEEDKGKFNDCINVEIVSSEQIKFIWNCRNYYHKVDMHKLVRDEQ